MASFHDLHGRDVRVCRAGRTAERLVHGSTVLLSSEPLQPGLVWTLNVGGTQNSVAVLGVTGCDPDTLTSDLPERARELPDSRVLGGYSLYRDGAVDMDCARLTVAPGDTYGVSWEKDRVTFYHNRSVFSVWDVDTPDTPQMWGVVQMVGLEKISI